MSRVVCLAGRSNDHCEACVLTDLLSFFAAPFGLIDRPIESWDKSPVANGAHYFLYGKLAYPGAVPGVVPGALPGAEPGAEPGARNWELEVRT